MKKVTLRRVLLTQVKTEGHENIDCAWKTPRGDPCVELFLGEMEHELFSFLPGKPQSYNLTKEECQALQNLKEGRAVILKSQQIGDPVWLCGFVKII